MNPLHHGQSCYVPREVAVCPECGGELIAKAMAWCDSTGIPDQRAIDIDCISWMNARPNKFDHQYQQSTWQPVRDAVAKWAGAE